jgi:hypothetical protein
MSLENTSQYRRDTITNTNAMRARDGGDSRGHQPHRHSHLTNGIPIGASSMAVKPKVRAELSSEIHQASDAIELLTNLDFVPLPCGATERPRTNSRR